MPLESYDLSPMRKGRGQQGTLRQLPSGRWQAEYRQNGRNGSRPRKSFDHKRDAQRWLRDRLDDVEAVRNGDQSIVVRERERGRTVDQALDAYLAAWDAAPPTVAKVTTDLKHARRAFGPRPLASLEPAEIQAWRKTATHGGFKAFRQALRQCRAWHWIVADPTDGIPNRRPPRRPVTPIPWETVVALTNEILEPYRAVPLFACGTGLRPEEWLALEWRDVDLDVGVLEVCRVYSKGRLIELAAGDRTAKSAAQRRRVPLRGMVVEALRSMPRGIERRLLFPARRAGRNGWLMDLQSFRRQIWAPTFDACGLPYQRPYDTRHTYAAESIAAGVNLFDLSRWMGTSLVEIDRTYGHLVCDSEDRGRALLDAYDQRRATG